MLKKNPFYEMHVKNGGKIVEFAGFLMPVQFDGIIPEHRAVRSSVGVFDVSHMGEIEIYGKDRMKFVNHLTTNDASTLELGQIQYTTMLYPDAGIVDDLLVYKFEKRILLVVNAANTDKDFQWIMDNRKYDIDIKNISDGIGQLAVQGPKAELVMQKLFDFDLTTLTYYWATEVNMNPASLKKTGIKDMPVILSRTGYTGEDGFEIYMDKQYAAQCWQSIFDAGAEYDIKPVGLGARDTLRFEMRYCLYGNDIDKTTNPLEAGLGWVVKFDKGDFNGRESLLKAKENGIKRRLVGFEVIGKGIPRPHQNIHVGDKNIGYVTSGTYSPSMNKGMGMGYVDKPYNKVGTRIEIMGKGSIEAEVIKGPFYKQGSHK
jgi:aminomethyltransferase